MHNKIHADCKRLLHSLFFPRTKKYKGNNEKILSLIEFLSERFFCATFILLIEQIFYGKIEVSKGSLFVCKFNKSNEGFVSKR